MALLIELRGLRGGGGTAQRNKKGPSNWSSYGFLAQPAWRSWKKGTAKRDFERRLNEMRRRQENDVERMEREITEELEKKDPDEAKILRLWDGLAVLKQQAEDRRQEQEQEDKDGVEYDYLEVLRGLKSEEPRDDDHTVRVKVTNQKHGVEFCFWVKGDAKMEVVVEKIKRVMGIPEHLLKMGVCGKELDASDAWHPVSVFWSVKEGQASSSSPPASAAGAEGTKELDVVVLFPIKLKGGGRSVKDTKGKKKDDPKAKARERKVMIQEIVEGGQTFNDMEGIDGDVKILKQRLNAITTSKPGRLIRDELEKQPIPELLKCQQDYTATTKLDVRNNAVCAGMFGEFRNIEKKVLSLTEIVSTTRSTVKLIYDMEFNKGGGNKKTFARVLNKVITKKAGGEVSDSDEEEKPLFSKKKGGDVEMKDY